MTGSPRAPSPISGRAAALAWIPSSYFALGLAYVTITGVSSVLFDNVGVPSHAAALWSSVLGAPYVLKPLWAPLLERGRGKRFAVVAAQLVFAGALAAAALALVLCKGVVVGPPVLGALLVAAFAGATQDIGSDGIYVSALAGEDQARFAGVQSLFWDLGPILATGLLVRLSGTFHTLTGRWETSWMAVLLIVAAVMTALAARHARALPGAGAAPAVAPARSASATFRAAFATFFRKKGIAAMIAFAFFYRFGLGLLEKIGPLFMIDDQRRGGLGLSNQTLGDINGTVGSAAFILGSLLGGFVVARRGLRRTLMPLCLCLAVSGASFLLLSWLRVTDLGAVTAFVAVEKLGSGVGCVGQMIYMMQEIAPGPYRATHYTFATTLMLLGLLLSGVLSGVVQGAVGYRWFFVVATIASAPSLLATRWAPFQNDEVEAGGL